MFIKSLHITSESRVVREITFRKGINLIVDDTSGAITGNNVGKTTVLKLIDFCLGAKPNGIWVDPETKKDEYVLVRDFLKDKKILVSLTLKEDLDVDTSPEIVIERNFLARKEIVRKINGTAYTEEEFEIELGRLIFPSLHSDKPTFRQLISHNIRYRDESINNTLKTLDRYSSDAEYETLHLFMLGIDFTQGASKQNVLAKLKQEETFKARLEKNQTRNAYETALSLIETDIENLNKRKSNFNLNENFETDLGKLTNVKYRLNSLSSELSNLNIRLEVIQEAETQINEQRSDVDTHQLRLLYDQAAQYIEGIQKTFEDLVEYHNQMIGEKVKYITKELPSLRSQIQQKENQINLLLEEERSLTDVVSKSESFSELEKLIGLLNEKFRQKGEYENVISQLIDVEEEIKKLNIELKEIDDTLFSETFEQNVKTQINKFNKYFAYVSEYLYGEQYALKYEIVTNKFGKRLYKFSAFNTNFSSGKKQGEISCFDIAYTMFADEEQIPCLHFILNDKKELMHDNQLVKINSLVTNLNIQFVASILRDKLPTELHSNEYFILELSQTDKLFRIEK